MKKNLYRIGLGLLGLLTMTACSASTASFQSVIEQTQAEAPQLAQSAHHTAAQFKPETVFTGYTQHLSESQYYTGVKASRSGHLDQAAQSAFTDSAAGDAVLSSVLQHPQYRLTAQDPVIQREDNVASNVDAWTQSMTNAYSDCHAKQHCEQTYTTHTCTQAALQPHPSCRKTLVVSALAPENAVQTVNLHITALPDHSWHPKATVTVDLTSGKAIATDGTVLTAKVTPLLQLVPCEGVIINALPAPTLPADSPVKVSVTTPPTCTNHFQVTLVLAATGFSHATLQTSISYRITAPLPPKIQESWQSQCPLLEQLQAQGLCQPQGTETCVEGKATRSIQGISVTRDCWALQSMYTCFQESSHNNCSALIAQGCEQIGSTCQTRLGKVCVAYQQTYRCLKKRCESSGEVICGDGNIYCLHGDCTDTHYTPSSDFEHSVSALSSTRDATQHFDGATVFKGTAQTCRDEIGNFSRCCSQGGWGQDIHLAQCSPEEKALGLQREQGSAVLVGRYCAHHLPWPLDHVCTEHKQSYCVFGSKLGRILQEQGRKHQLHQGFGSAEYPDCSGLTPEQLQRIDLAKINFTDFYADLKGAVQTPDRLRAIQERIADFQRQGQTHD